MIKLASNAFLATKISFVNEIANVSEQVGADVTEVAKGMGLDPRIGAGFLNPGLGYGGSCFPKDVRALQALAGSSGYSFQLLSAVIEVNDRQKQRVMEKLAANLGSLEGKRVALLGLSFKPGTDDMREASSIFLAHRLAEAGAEVVGYDPVAREMAQTVLPEVSLAETPLAALTEADAAVLVTEWPELIALDWSAAAEAMSGNLVVDGRNSLPVNDLVGVGLVVESIGRPRREGDT
jgi:UDPglucose 6-dehydrogenase